MIRKNNITGRFSKCLAEFEFRAKNFQLHGHDPVGCDVVICWENDWPECPMEVIELKDVVERLKRDE